MGDGEIGNEVAAGREAEAGLEADAASEHAALLDRLRRKDAQALTALTREFSSALTRTAWLYLGDAHAAEDAAQETLIAAWDGASRTTASTSLRSWLMGILINRCRLHVRSAQRRRRRERQAIALRVIPAADGGRDVERLGALRVAMDSLDGAHREVVLLRFHQGLSVEQAAAALGVPAGTVKSRCHAAIARLRQAMEAQR